MICFESQGVKYDKDKLRWDLLPTEALEELVKVYTMGAKKYEDRNWEKGIKYTRIFAAIMRHAWGWFKGEDKDLESGLHPLAHAAWGCLALIHYSKYNKDMDNRPKYNEEN